MKRRELLKLAPSQDVFMNKPIKKLTPTGGYQSSKIKPTIFIFGDQDTAEYGSYRFVRNKKTT